jgi:hypothetical protein
MHGQQYIKNENGPIELTETHILYHPLIFIGCAFFLVVLTVLLSGPKSKSEQNQPSCLEGENEPETTSQFYVNFIHFVQLSALQDSIVV